MVVNPVIYEDETLLALNKPAGLPSVPRDEGDTSTAVDLALKHCPTLSGLGRKDRPHEAGLLNRLDTATSGLLLFAKTQKAFDALEKDWTTGRVRKVYRALSQRVDSETPLPEIPSIVRAPLGASAKSAKRMIVVGEEKKFLRRIRGRPLETVTRLLRASEVHPDVFDFEIEIETGVRHQIRCHLAHLGWPVMGDELYKGAKASRLFLHAWKLELIHPLSGKKLMIEAPISF
jgi:23S rRNA pseudouridine1911/1915/1917 synthase